MMRAVATAIERRDVLLVEAGTGTGKTLAYLVPAALSQQQVILSTGTKTLQDQLYQRAVPFVRDTLGADFTAAVLKGRTNYLCLHALELARRDPRLALDDHAELAAIRAWSERTRTGDRAELTELADGATIWRAVTVGAEQCLGRRCPHFDGCFVMAARRRAEAADVVIVNHHLFFADLGLREHGGFGLLPQADAVVFDEAHRLEDVAAAHFGVAVSDHRLYRLGRDVERLLDATDMAAERLRRDLARLTADTRDLYARYRGLLPKARLRRHALDAYARLDNTLRAVIVALDALHDGGDEAIERLITRADAIRDDLEEIALCRSPHRFVHWVEAGPRAVSLRAAPVEVGELLERALFERFPAVVFTSATLTTSGTFDHFRRRVGLGTRGLELRLDSPFDYAHQALLYTPADLPQPRHHAFAAAAADRIEALVRLTEGRALLLFTSFRMLELVHELVAERLPYPLLVQGEGSKEALLREFRATAESVLFATASFWEGVDIVGDALSLVVIDKLPFAPPGDPMVDARISAVEADGGDPFIAYQVPNAILTLKQGVGRLIRHRGDRGIIAVLDPRLSTKRYGHMFIDSLPPARHTYDLELLGQWWRTLSAPAPVDSLETRAQIQPRAPIKGWGPGAPASEATAEDETDGDGDSDGRGEAEATGGEGAGADGEASEAGQRGER
ncbi:MAG: helicase [Proteobacteria bacterium]|nr:MAG: helicase [Pseudomonadota bacterium]